MQHRYTDSPDPEDQFHGREAGWCYALHTGPVDFLHQVVQVGDLVAIPIASGSWINGAHITLGTVLEIEDTPRRRTAYTMNSMQYAHRFLAQVPSGKKWFPAIQGCYRLKRACENSGEECGDEPKFPGNSARQSDFC